jgi:iron-sulfur cluster insertion protein
MMETAVAVETTPILVTESAARRISEIVKDEENSALMLRVAISGGGCAGFDTGFSLDDNQNEDDTIIECHGVKVIIDEMSLDLIRGSEVDFVEDLMGSAFTLKNPNARSTCSCGTSFSL